MTAHAFHPGLVRFRPTRSSLYRLPILQQSFTCSECELSFQTKQGLKQHRKAKHNEQTCEVCNRSFLSRRALDQHAKALHHQCSRCGRCFSSRTALEQHTKAIHPIRHGCGFCDRSFTSRAALDQHMEANHPRTSNCPACGQARFRSITGALQHLESGQCSHCQGKQTARSQVYQAISPHLSPQQRTTDDNFLLTGSTSSTGISSNNNAEQLPDFPYACDQCTKQFRELNHLMQHKADKHKTSLQALSPSNRYNILPSKRY